MNHKLICALVFLTFLASAHFIAMTPAAMAGPAPSVADPGHGVIAEWSIIDWRSPEQEAAPAVWLLGPFVPSLIFPALSGNNDCGIAGSDGSDMLVITTQCNVEENDPKNVGDVGLSLTGDAAADVSIESKPRAKGVSAGGGDDTVEIHAAVSVTSTARASAGLYSLNLFDASSANAGISADAVAVSIEGEAGSDTIINTDDIVVKADSTADAFTLDATLINATGGAVNAELNAVSEATGIDGGDDGDTLINTNTILVEAASFAKDRSLSLALFGNGSIASETISTAEASGIIGGDGDDVIRNDKQVTVDALSQIHLNDSTVSVAQGLGVVDARILGSSVAVGLDGGPGDDTVTNNDKLDVMARTLIYVQSLNPEPIALDPLTESASALAGPESWSLAMGITGGDGNDNVVNNGTIMVMADPDPNPATTETFVLEIDFTAIGNAMAVAGAQTAAKGIGMDGGSGDDTITNNSVISVSASPDATIVAATAGLDLVPVIPVIRAGADADLAVSAQTYGITAGDGDDTVTNGGLIKADATASLTSIEAKGKLNVGPKIKLFESGGSDTAHLSAPAVNDFAMTQDVTSGVTSSPSEVTAQAIRYSSATGITGDNGNDVITNEHSGTIQATSDVCAIDVNGTAALSISYPLEAAPASLQSGEKSSALAAATPPGAVDEILNIDATSLIDVLATGIDGGEGNDTIKNLGNIEAKAHAEATNVAGKATLSLPVPISVVPTVALLNDASAAIISDAVGLAGGHGDDMLINDGLLEVTAESIATSVTGTIEPKPTIPIPVSFFDMRADANSKTLASATGMQGDEIGNSMLVTGDDVITNSGMMLITADAEATAASGVLTLGGSALGSASTTVGATATGIDGGVGCDEITNKGKLDVMADVTALDIGIQASLVLGAAIGTADTDIKATSAGIQGGEGADTIKTGEMGAITSKATSSGDVTQADITIAPGATIASASSKARSIASGIDGGEGDDDIQTDRRVTTEAKADINARSISVTLLSTGYSDFPLPQGAQALSTGTEASAEAMGIGGGSGNDFIKWQDRVDVDAASHADALLIAAVGTGASLGAATTTSFAKALGVGGGDGDDDIGALGLVTADAVATSGIASFAVSGLVSSDGASVGAGMNLVAEAFGVDGGTGNDMIDILDDVYATACANSGPDDLADDCPPADLAVPPAGATGLSISLIDVEPSVAGLALVTSITDATANAVSGSEGRDRITNSRVISADADAEGRSGSVVVSLVGKASSTVITNFASTATGMSGGVDNDTLINKLIINASAETVNKDLTVDVDLVGATLVDMSTNATAVATGIDGNDGNDEIRNEHTVTASADAAATSIAVQVDALLDVVGVLGSSNVDEIDTKAEAIATGLAGGEGDDLIISFGQTSVEALSSANATVVAYATGGSLINEGGITATAEGVGLDGGEGNDRMGSKQVVVNACAETGTTRVQAEVGGNSEISAETRVVASALALSGGGGDDIIDITGAIEATTDARTTDDAWSVVLFGEGSQAASMYLDSVATVVSGGDGCDILINSIGNHITAIATATGTSNEVNVDLVGAARGEAAFDATAISAGMHGDAGADSLLNMGIIDGDAISTATFSSIYFSLAGSATSVTGSADTVADTFDVGMAGDDGVDWLKNTGSIDINTTATVQTDTNSTISIIGAAGTSATLAARPSSIGIDGGSDDDTIVNQSLVDVSSFAIADLSSGSAFSFAGTASDTAEVGAGARSTGLAGGGGLDRIENTGTVKALSDSYMEVGSGSTVVFGQARSAGHAVATADAIGIDGGADADWISNLAALAATSSITLESTASSFAIFGSPSANPALSAGSRSTGIAAGDGDDHVRNEAEGTISVTASAKPSTTGDSRAVLNFGTVSGSAKLDTEVHALGIGATFGNDVLENLGTINVVADSDTRASNTSQAGVFAGNTASTAHAVATIQAAGMDGGEGDNELFNTGTITSKLTLLGSEPCDGPTVLADANALGPFGNITVTSDAKATASAALSAALKGLAAGDGANSVVNTGRIEVLNAPEVKAVANADGDGIDGDGSGQASVWVGANAPDDTENPARVLSAAGIAVGDGDNVVTNRGELDIKAEPVGNVSANVDGDLFGSAIATVNSTVQSLAIGIQTGDGSNVIVNEGSMLVSSDPSAWIEIIAGTSAGSSNATAVSRGIGILSGDGGSEVFNSGIVNVRAGATATGTTDIMATATATGIQTGHGDDRVFNTGAIVTRVVVNNAIPEAGVGISTGDGNDTVALYDPVEFVDPDTDDILVISVKGDVDLGAGDDALYLVGSPIVVGNILPEGTGSPDSGIDSLIFEGTGFFANPLDDFDRATKQGTGTYTVPSLPSMQWLEVKEGTLQTDSDYNFSSDGIFQTTVNRDGSHGKLHVMGSSVLDGELTVLRGQGAYVNGTRYDIIEAAGTHDGIVTAAAENSITGGFSHVHLPAHTPLLSFKVNQLPNLVEVEALVESYTKVAKNRSELAVAKYLDRITPTATGDLSNVIGEFQALSLSEFSAAFAGLNPGQHDISTRTTIDVTHQYTQTLLKRIHSLRLTGETASPVPNILLISGKEKALFAYSGSDQSIHRLASSGAETQDTPAYGLWFNAFSQNGDQDENNGFTGYEYDLYGGTIGLDRIFRDRYIIGIGLGYSKADLDLDGDQGDGEIESIYGSIYGSYYTEKGYLDAALSYGDQDYKNKRRAFLDRTAKSDHDGDTFSAFAEGGYNIDLNKWILQPFASLQYILLNEEGFREKGAGSINQIIGDRDTESLVSELGLRLAHVYQKGIVTVIPEVSAAWNYDFDIDDRVIRTAFAGSPNESFSIRGQDVQKHGATVGAGLTFMNNSGFSTTLKYHGEFREKYQAHGVMGELRYEF